MFVGGLADTLSSGISSVASAVLPGGGDDDADPGFGISLSGPYMPANTAILYGNFVAQSKDWGPSGKFVYVPKGWVKPDSEYITKIFAALGITVPNLVFATYDCGPSLYPDIGLRNITGTKALSVVTRSPDEAQKTMFKSYVSSKLNTLMKPISTAFVNGGAIYLCNNASRDNAIVNTILQTIPKEGVVLAISSLKGGKNVGFTKSMADTIRRNVVPLTDPVEKPVIWSKGGNNRFALGIKNFLIFEDAEDSEYFETVLGKLLPVGVFCAAGAGPLMTTCIQKLRQGLPIIIFKHTTGTGHCMGSLVEYYEKSKSGKKKKKKTSSSKSATEGKEDKGDEKAEGGEKDAEGVDEETKESDPAEAESPAGEEKPSENDKGDVPAHLNRDPDSDAPAPTPEEEEPKVEDDGKKPLPENADEISAAVDALLYPDGINAYGLIEDHKNMSHELIFNWPEDEYNQESILIVDPLDTRTKQADFVLKVTGVVNSVHKANAELGGEEAEFALLDQAASLYAMLVRLHRLGTYVAAVISVLIILMKMAITCIAVIINYIGTTSIPASDPTVLNGLGVLNTVLPIALGITMTINSTYQPVERTDALKFAKERLLSEWFRFRMRVGPYEPKYGQPPGANREAFQKVLEAILNELGGIDIASFMPDIANDESGGYKKIERVQRSIHKRVDIVTLTVKEYMEERVAMELKLLGREGPKISRLNMIFTVIITCLSSGAALFSGFGLSAWVPAILAFVAAQEAFVAFRKLPVKNAQTNSAFTKLNQLTLWWEGLPLIKQRLPNFKEQLVTQVEAVLLGKAQAITGGVVNKAAKRQGEEGADGSGDGAEPAVDGEEAKDGEKAEGADDKAEDKESKDEEKGEKDGEKDEDKGDKADDKDDKKDDEKGGKEEDKKDDKPADEPAPAKDDAAAAPAAEEKK